MAPESSRQKKERLERAQQKKDVARRKEEDKQTKRQIFEYMNLSLLHKDSLKQLEAYAKARTISPPLKSVFSRLLQVHAEGSKGTNPSTSNRSSSPTSTESSREHSAPVQPLEDRNDVEGEDEYEEEEYAPTSPSYGTHAEEEEEVIHDVDESRDDSHDQTGCDSPTYEPSSPTYDKEDNEMSSSSFLRVPCVQFQRPNVAKQSKPEDKSRFSLASRIIFSGDPPPSKKKKVPDQPGPSSSFMKNASRAETPHILPMSSEMQKQKQKYEEEMRRSMDRARSSSSQPSTSSRLSPQEHRTEQQKQRGRTSFENTEREREIMRRMHSNPPINDFSRPPSQASSSSHHSLRQDDRRSNSRSVDFRTPTPTPRSSSTPSSAPKKKSWKDQMVLTCPFCSASHHPEKCTEYETIAKRRQRINDLGWCLFCIGEHHASNCTAPVYEQWCRVKNCGKRHHIAFCPNKLRN